MESEPSNLRISDTEREDAISKLGEHLRIGRLDVDEYGERTAQVAAAKTRGELLAQFQDLPDPRPQFGSGRVGTSPGRAAAPPRPEGQPQRWDDRPLVQRVWAAAVPLSAILAVVLFFTIFREWYVFLLPAAIAVVGGAVWGEDWKHDRRHWDRHHWDHRRRRDLGRGD